MSSPRDIGPAAGERLESAYNRFVPRGTRTVVVLVAATVLIGILIWQLPDDVPLVSLLVPLVVSSLVLGPRQLGWESLATQGLRRPSTSLRPGASSRT